MAARTCGHCGELFDDERRLVCPHCGADADFTYAETPAELVAEDEEEGYEDFLEREGLAGDAPRRRGGCAAGAVFLLAGTLAALLRLLL